MVNETIAEVGGRVARNMTFRGEPSGWREPVLGFIPAPLLWNIIVVGVVALIFWWLLRGSQKHGDTPMDLLKKRYVSGEIDRKTYLQMKEDIKD
ncbi:MAG: hypothetical protein V1921_05495 [Candidatus Altiarchaeota archaeon]